MSITLHNIPGAEPPPNASHATSARGNVIVHISGQVGTDESGALVAGGLAAQTERALLNVARALEAAGASLDDVAKSTFYVVDWDPSMLEELSRGGAAARAQIPFRDVAITLVGVKSLFTPEMLIEIDAVAVIDS
jgi:enamine deaminase RidA (YjgF/YER057c/UK114 family)